MYRQRIGFRRVRPSRQCRLNNIFETCNLPAISFELMIGSAHHASREIEHGPQVGSVHRARVGWCEIRSPNKPMGETGLKFSPTSGSDRFLTPVADARRAAERPLGGSHLQSAIWLTRGGHGSIGVHRAPPPSRRCTQRVRPYLWSMGRGRTSSRSARASQSTPLTGSGITRNAPEARVRAVDHFQSSPRITKTSLHLNATRWPRMKRRLG